MGDERARLKFDIAALLTRFRKLPVEAEATVSIRLPGLQLTARVDDVEKRVARELMVRLADKRVLNAQECCDSCIEGALASLQEIRQLLVDKQVELVKRTDSPLYLLLEMMTEGIRQFLTFEQNLGLAQASSPRSPEVREAYFTGLAALRAHLNGTATQIAAMADVPVPLVNASMRPNEVWDLEAYDLDQVELEARHDRPELA
jgi:hypothetical protein